MTKISFPTTKKETFNTKTIFWKTETPRTTNPKYDTRVLGVNEFIEGIFTEVRASTIEAFKPDLILVEKKENGEVIRHVITINGSISKGIEWSKAQIGDALRVTYLGEGEQAQKGRRKPKLFKVLKGQIEEVEALESEEDEINL